MAVTAQQIGREVLQALGLEGKSVTGIKIEMNGRDPVTLEVSMLPERSQVVNIIAQLEAGEIEPCETGCVVLMGKSGTLDTLGFGPKSDDLQVIGLLEMGKQVILEAAMYPEP